jgi:hypothetical protein
MPLGAKRLQTMLTRAERKEVLLDYTTFKSLLRKLLDVVLDSTG